MTELDRCDRELAAIESQPIDAREAMGATIGWLDWSAERELILEEQYDTRRRLGSCAA